MIFTFGRSLLIEQAQYHKEILISGKRFLGRFFFSVLFILLPAAAGSTSTAEDSPLLGAVPGRELHFPEDHGKHPKFQTEWWYFTGNLDSADNTQLGFQLTFFRRSVNRTARVSSKWSIKDLYAAHFAITNVTGKKFFHSGLVSREGPGLASAAAGGLDVHLRNWKAEMKGENIVLEAVERGYKLSLTLTPEKPVVLHGDKGFSQKTENPEQASYYYSFTRLNAKGTVTFDDKPLQVRGSVWMDHEFGSGILSEDQTGWDWFSIQLENGTELMISYIRRKDGSRHRPFGTLIEKNGDSVSLTGDEIVVKSVDYWRSEETRTTYPSAWVLEIPRRNISLNISSLVADQEIKDQGTGVVYWEGAVAAAGTMNGLPVKGRGYVELTGYARSMGGLL